MHEHDRNLFRGHKNGQLGIEPQRTDVVDDIRTLIQCRLGDLCLVGIDGDWNIDLPSQPSNHRQNSFKLFSRRHRPCSRPRRLSPNVDNVGARFDQPQAMGDRIVGVQLAAAIVKGVGSHIENAHQQRPPGHLHRAVPRLNHRTTGGGH
jgi:hypothetical protein